MYAQVDTIGHRLRLVASGLLVIAGLFVLITFLTALATYNAPVSASEGDTSTSKSQRFNQSYNDPNAVSAGMSDMMGQLGQAGSSIGHAANATVASLASASIQTGQMVGRVSRTCGIFAAQGVVGSVRFIIHAPGAVLGSVSDSAPVSAIIKPANDSQVPVIDPLAASLLAARTTLPASQVAAQPIPIATNESDAIWPIHGAITTHFGEPEPPYQPIHTGLDISDGQRSGVTPIVPFKPGRVTSVVLSNSGLGNHVVVDHGNGMTSVYAHLASVAVQEGQNVNKSTVLGREGSTGASTGPHLHFEIRINGTPVDPLKYISGRP